MEKLTCKGSRFVNESGKEVLLQGINVLCRSHELGHFYPDFDRAFPYFQRAGFNLLRFGIFWEAVEPAPGVIDREYLARVKQLVRKAEENGIYVILDMHQDLFAQKFIDGAPDWACLDEGLPHPDDCSIWYEAYLRSDAIIRAADNFWANKQAADGIGLLDHYEAMWEEIAAFFADCANVAGLEPMNEPFMGSIARSAFGEAAMRMLAKDPAFDLGRPDRIPPEEAAEFMGYVAEKFLDFDRDVLMDFYRRMQRAISRRSSLAIVTGGNIYCSTDVPTGIGRLESGMQIYAPHGYDSVVDSDRYDSYSTDNVARLFAGKRASQDRLGLPTIIGEWGAFPSRPFTNGLIRFMNGILEQNLWGSAYCEYHPGMEDDPNFTALCRAYPMETAGTLRSYHYDGEEGSLEVRYAADEDGTSCFFVPFVPGNITCSLPFSAEVTEHGPGSSLVRIRTKQEGEASLTIRRKEKDAE